MTDLVKYKLGKDIKVVTSRVALDRQRDNKPKGFGYVEVETQDDVSFRDSFFFKINLAIFSHLCCLLYTSDAADE